MASLRSSIERRRVSNARVTTIRNRKYQDLTVQREQEKIRKATETLERRKRERNRLNAYMHIPCPPPPRPPDPFEALRNTYMDDIHKRPPWTGSLRSDYETLIRLREKEIALASSRLDNKKRAQYNMNFGETILSIPAENDSPILFNEESERLQDAPDPENLDKVLNMNGTSKGCHVRNEMGDLEDELFALATERPKFYRETSRDFLRMEPAVFRERSYKNLRPGSASLPPKSPSTKVTCSPLKSCLKTCKEEHRFSSNVLRTPRDFSEPTLNRDYSRTAPSLSTPVVNLGVKYSFVSMSSPPQSPPTSVGTKSSQSDMSLPEHHEVQNVDETNSSVQMELVRKWTPLESTERYSTTKLHHSMPTVVSGLKESAQLVTPVTDTRYKRPTLGHWMETGKVDVPSPSNRDTVSEVLNRETDTSSSAWPSSNLCQQYVSMSSALPPNYCSTSACWQDDMDLDSPRLEECKGCSSPPLPPRAEESDIDRGFLKDEIFITSLDSEAATTRLIAEVIAVQSRLEECKLKPLDFREFLSEPAYPVKAQSWVKHYTGDVKTSVADPCRKMNSFSKNGEQSVVQENFIDHEIGIPEEVHYCKLARESNVDEKSAAHTTCTIDADSNDVNNISLSRKALCIYDNGEDISFVHELQPKGPLEETAREITWKNEATTSFSRNKRLETGPDVERDKSERHMTFRYSSPPPLPTSAISLNPTLAKVESSASAVSDSEVFEQLKPTMDQKPPTKHAMMQTDVNLGRAKQSPHSNRVSSEFSANLENQQCNNGSRNEEGLNDRSLMSTERTSRYLNVGYRDLCESPQPKLPKQHCFYSSQGLMETGYSQPRNVPQSKQNVYQDIRHDRLFTYHDSSGDKENHGMSGQDDQELSILASLERLDWKLAAISVRTTTRTNVAPSLISQGQSSIRSAPAAMGEIRGESDVPSVRRPRTTAATNPTRPSVRKAYHGS